MTYDGLQLGMRLVQLARIDIDASRDELRLIQIRRTGEVALHLAQGNECRGAIALTEGVDDLLVFGAGIDALLVDVGAVPAPRADDCPAHRDSRQDPQGVFAHPPLDPFPLFFFR